MLRYTENNNIYQSQIQGPFSARQNIVDLIKLQIPSEFQSSFKITHIGITTDVGAIVELDDNPSAKDLREVGKTGMYEIGNTRVRTIRFQEDKDNNTIIDYVVEKLQ